MHLLFPLFIEAADKNCFWREMTFEICIQYLFLEVKSAREWVSCYFVKFSFFLSRPHSWQASLVECSIFFNWFYILHLKEWNKTPQCWTK